MANAHDGMDAEPNPPAVDPLHRSAVEELINSLTHGIGLALSLAGGVLLILQAASQNDPRRLAGCVVFAATLIAVYAASTLSHAVTRPKLRRAFRVLDQGLIYLLIVGTYTPLALAYLRGGWWGAMLAGLWTAAFTGFLSKLLFFHRIDAVTVWSYLLLAWTPILPSPAYLGLVPAGALWWVFIGGVCYTAGTVFLVCDYRRLHFHGIWHLLVMAGSACHYWAIFQFVACAKAASAIGSSWEASAL